MGTIATSVLENNGKVIGVLPRFLQKVEIAHDNLTELILVETMHQGKTKMDELSDGVITLPGGFGTLEEFFLNAYLGAIRFAQKTCFDSEHWWVL